MKPASYYLLYLTRLTDRPTGYLFNHFFLFFFFFFLHVCVGRLCVWHARRKKLKKWQQEQTRQKGMPDFYSLFFSFLFFFNFHSFFFWKKKRKIMKIHTHRHTKTVFLCVCVFRSVRQLVAVGAVIKYTHAHIHRQETHQTDSLIMLSATAAPALPYRKIRGNGYTPKRKTWGFLSPIFPLSCCSGV